MYKNIQIYFDFDGVIHNSVKAITEFYNLSHNTNYNWLDIISWDCSELPNLSTEEMLGYFDNPHFYNWPNVGFLETFGKLCEIPHVLPPAFATLGTPVNLQIKQQFINMYLSQYSPNFHASHFMDINKTSWKSLDLKHENAPETFVIMIDDNYKNLRGIVADMRVLFGDDFDWCNDSYCKGEIAMKRIHSWTELYRYVNGLSKSIDRLNRSNNEI